MMEPTFPATLKSERLELSRYRENDAESLVRLIGPERERLRRNFPDIAKGLNTAAEADAFILDCGALWQDRKTFHYGVWTRDSGALIGQLKVKNVTWNVPSAELSYFIGTAFQRKGYATEAIRAVLREAFERLGFTRIYARIIASNTESLELARKLGLKHEGLHRQEFRCGYGELHDVNYFSVIREEYPEIARELGH